MAFSYQHRPCISHRCLSPTIGALKLNFDGRALGNLGLSGVGGVIHNDHGTILPFYSGPVGFCLINKAEYL